ncbi:hypothetical protein NE237_021568 [Protea cynaroides]|uniref:Uncharacterized protein n=1 Tax=Protea cynaroides TaxID=273540 RepID=A0A9Q0HBG1_9MAGN|nr:hypothetical protein NE237_021568 [Protea cynaroides]
MVGFSYGFQATFSSVQGIAQSGPIVGVSDSVRVAERRVLDSLAVEGFNSMALHGVDAIQSYVASILAEVLPEFANDLVRRVASAAAGEVNTNASRVSLQMNSMVLVPAPSNPTLIFSANGSSTVNSARVSDDRNLQALSLQLNSRAPVPEQLTTSMVFGANGVEVSVPMLIGASRVEVSTPSFGVHAPLPPIGISTLIAFVGLPHGIPTLHGTPAAVVLPLELSAANTEINGAAVGFTHAPVEGSVTRRAYRGRKRRWTWQEKGKYIAPNKNPAVYAPNILNDGGRVERVSSAPNGLHDESCKRHVEQQNMGSEPGISNSDPKDPVINSSCATATTSSGLVPVAVSAPLASANVSIPIMSRHGVQLDHTNSVCRGETLNSTPVLPQNTSWADMAENDDESDVDGENAMIDGDGVRTNEVGGSVLVPGVHASASPPPSSSQFLTIVQRTGGCSVVSTGQMGSIEVLFSDLSTIDRVLEEPFSEILEIDHIVSAVEWALIETKCASAAALGRTQPIDRVELPLPRALQPPISGASWFWN